MLRLLLTGIYWAALVLIVITRRAAVLAFALLGHAMLGASHALMWRLLAQGSAPNR